MNIAFFGLEGSYTFFATQKYFVDEETDLVSCVRFEEVFKRVEDGDVAYGVVPVENSLAGSVVENLDNLLKYDVEVVGEVYLKIEHCLLGRSSGSVNPGSVNPLSVIRKVFGHPQALAQCGGFFEINKDIEKVAWGDNASAVKYVAERQVGGGQFSVISEEHDMAAIGSRETGEMYGLSVLAEGIADSELNVTRFLVIARKKNSEGYIGQVYDHRYPGVMKLSLYFTVAHERGSLVRVLKQFEEMGLNLTKIESRPIKDKTFEYGFYVDAVGDVSRVDLEESVEDVVVMRVLGVYRETNILG
jgi:prephenate dehydratase